MELKTPLFNLKNYTNVYEPSEDTFLLLDALEQELGSILNLKPLFIAEIGSGSGIVISALANILKSITFCFATDINLEASEATAFTSKLNNVIVENVNMNFLCNFTHNVFDIVLFNPPYVVTDSAEIAGNSLNRAWAGGDDGREVINEFLELLPTFLSEWGVCYMVAIKENKVEDIKDAVSKFRLCCDIIKDRKIPGEHLFVLKIYKKH